MTGEPLRISTMGCRWRIDVERIDPRLADRLRELWRRCDHDVVDPDEPVGMPGNLVLVHTGDTDRGADTEHPVDAIEVSHDLDTAPYGFSGALTLRSIARQAGRLTLLHGAALADPQTGAGVVLVAESGTGKTTAARTLGRVLGYLSDETAAIRADETLIAHPKPLSVIPEPGQAKIEMSPDAAGLLPAPEGAWLAATILLHREPGWTTPTLEPVDLIDGLLDTIAQSSSLPAQDRPLDTLARVLTAGAGVHRLRYGEIGDALEQVTGLLAAVRRGQHTVRDWRSIEPPPERRSEPWTASPGIANFVLPQGARLERAPWLDALAVADQVVVLNGPRPMRLRGLGATVWLECAAPRERSDIHRAVRDQHGPHPDAERLVDAAIESLAAEGLIEVAVLGSGDRPVIPTESGSPPAGFAN